jgi:hypothetical protein
MRDLFKYFMELVSEFHITFDHPSHTEPYLDDEELNQLRIDLLMEEIREYLDAKHVGNRVEMLDGLCDMQYVLSGAALAWGLQGYINGSNVGYRNIEDELVELTEMKTPSLSLLKMQLGLMNEVLGWGFTDVFRDAFTEVHRSNMSKMWTDQDVIDGREIALKSIVYPVAERDGRKWVVKRKDGKILKPKSYSPANLIQFLNPERKP